MSSLVCNIHGPSSKAFIIFYAGLMSNVYTNDVRRSHRQITASEVDVSVNNISLSFRRYVIHRMINMSAEKETETDCNCSEK